MAVATDGREVLDFHVRLAPVPGAPDRLLATMDECGIGRAVVCAGGTMPLAQLSRFLVEGGHIESDADNEAVLRACAASDGRLIPFYFANPHRAPEHYRRAAADFRGVEISPAVHGVALDDPRTAGLVEVARDVGHSVYTVCLERPGSRVADLVTLAARHPEVTFVLGHAGIGNIDLYAVESIAPLPNVLLETSGGYTCVARAAVEQLGADRVLFGSEAPLQHPEVELTKLRRLGIGDDDWQMIAWRNASRLLGLEGTE
ncbi:amidohydrolase family protein [Streptomyces caniscabiei]|uniref:amidohydrolase family protein n=1 Tax=Streptomyces caniscabiei TaxID=2746961 RepID=UPI0029BB7437|nr:amidohydrolase family protein [Streptomyces caniscabiei]MDX2600080.1 amidohydrolase family protein [Streptomyces caniscabiei]MDX2734627.1 amidohydrolase family protein [Streptomyces caniscabiei]MDX2777188.1 amidohydrolase family protein [Streptomyces caniscabiei]